MMNLLSTLILLASLPLINAQNENSATSASAAASTTAASSATGSVHTVEVGEAGLSFSPASMNVAIGDKVEFHFYSPAHSVAQASFDKPCQPVGSGGFYSGLMRTDSESKTVFTVTVNNTDPIWYYCGVQGHCQAGMVGVINPPSSGQNTLDAFKTAAGNVKDTSVPADVFGGVLSTASPSSGNASTTSGASASKTSAATSTTTNAAVTLHSVGDVTGLMLLGLFSWLMI